MNTTTIASSIPNESVQFVCGAKVSTPEDEIDFLEAFGPDSLPLYTLPLCEQLPRTITGVSSENILEALMNAIGCTSSSLG